MGRVVRGTGENPNKNDEQHFYSQLKRALRKITVDIAAHVALADPHTQYAKESDTAFNAPSTPDYLVGTAQAGLSSEIVVGTTPGGELGGTWPSPTVDATHSGSSHAATQAAAEATAAAALAQPHHTVRSGAGVPSGAPTGTELPIAVDTTAVTGGVYFWDGANWVLAASI